MNLFEARFAQGSGFKGGKGNVGDLGKRLGGVGYGRHLAASTVFRRGSF